MPKGIPLTSQHKFSLRLGWLKRKNKGLGIPWNKGKKLSITHRDNLSKSHLGKPSHRKGKKYGSLSIDLRNKLSLIKKGKLPKNYHYAISKANEYNRSHPRSKEFYKKISLLGLQKQNHSKEPTSIEKIVYDFLRSKGIIFEQQKFINNKFCVDVYIPGLNLVIECDGDYWHNLEETKKRDKAKNAYLLKCGYNLIRLTETEIRNNSFNKKLKF